MKDKLDGGITQADFDEWKKKHGIIHKIAIVVSKNEAGEATDKAIGYIKDVNDDLAIISNALTYQQTDVLKAKIFILENAWLGGDDRIKNNTKIKIAAAVQAGKTVDLLEGEVEKL
jgi:hypothetical protein